MSKMNSFRKNNFLFLFFPLSLVLLDHLYYQFMSPYIGIWFIIAVEISWIALWFVLVCKWFSAFSLNILNIIGKETSDSDVLEEVIENISKNDVFADIVIKFINFQNSKEKEQQELLKKLKHSNMLLQRSSKITDSIMKITNQILVSGEIDEILQTILEKAIEIIPNAQKGSILIYNGSNLEYRAAHGYDYKVLKNVTLEV